MPVRRQADPISVQHVWDAIRSANAQRQMADITRITKYLQRCDNCSQAQAELYVKQSLEDGLIISLNKVTVKGSKAGEQVESYKIPIIETSTPEKDDYDWYCFECHLAGDVTLCRMCHRVYHPECGYKNQKSLKPSAKTNNAFNKNGQADEKDTPTSPLNSPLSPKADTSLEGNDIINLSDDLNTSNGENMESKQDAVNNADQVVTVDDDSAEETEVINLNDSSTSQDSQASLEACKPDVLAIDKENDISSSKTDNNVLSSNKDEDEYDETLCSICNMSRSEPDILIEKEELNYLLRFVHNRIKSWLPSVITDSISNDEKPEWFTDSEMNWRAQQLFYQPMNMAIMEMKLQTQEYTKASQFKADVLTVRHNIAIYHGIESQEFGAAEYMRNDCEYDISELINCVDCYQHSNEKINEKWFCLPCRTPHTLVWAKQKGYPFWPAKVIKVLDDTYDVRFFGGKYERSVLPSSQIKSIADVPRDSHGKKGSALVKAIEELKLHQKMLDNPDELKKHLKASRRKSQSKPIKSAKKLQSTKRSKSTELPSKDVYEFQDSPANGDALNFELKNNKRRRSTSPLIKAKTPRIEYPTRKSVQNQIKTKTKTQNGATKSNVSNDVANVPPNFEEQEAFAMKNLEYEFGKSCDSGHEEVTSSTERVSSANSNEGYIRENSDGVMPQPDRQYCEAVERMGREMQQTSSSDRKNLIKIAQEHAQAEIDRVKREHEDYLKQVFELHNTQISETKKKQWCFNCEQDAIYHCCWNTAYCSPTCQQQHWQAEHKKVCRRKR